MASWVTEWLDGWVKELSAAKDGALPECPFAKAAWDAGEVGVVETQELWAAIHQQIAEFGPHRIVICVQPEADQEYDELEAACAALNDWFIFRGRDIWLLSSEKDGSNIVFVQRRSDLNTASHALERLGYYVDYAEEDFDRLILQRRRVA